MENVNTQIDPLTLLRTRARCGACGGKIGRRLNIVSLRYRATWDYPCSGNVITGTDHEACAVLCDRCIDAKATIKEAIEMRDGQPVYHALETLEKLGPEQTYALVRSPRGTPGIECLRCGLVSWNQKDVAEKYCGHCGKFHEG